MVNRVDLVKQAFDHVDSQLRELSLGIDPGHAPMEAYVRDLRLKVRGLKMEFASRCRRESGE